MIIAERAVGIAPPHLHLLEHLLVDAPHAVNQTLSQTEEEIDEEAEEARMMAVEAIAVVRAILTQIQTVMWTARAKAARATVAKVIVEVKTLPKRNLSKSKMTETAIKMIEQFLNQYRG